MQINGKLLKQLRLQRSWSQEMLAEAVGVNLRTIQRIESTGSVSLRTRRSIAAALDIDPSALDAASRSGQRLSQGPTEIAAAPSIVLGLYVVAVVLLFGFVTLDQIYAFLISENLAVVNSNGILSEVADFLLQFTGIAVLLAIAAMSLIWPARRARILLFASVFLGLILPLVVVAAIGGFAPQVWDFLDQSRLGAVMRLTIHAVAVGFAVWCWLDFRSNGRADQSWFSRTSG